MFKPTCIIEVSTKSATRSIRFSTPRIVFGRDRGRVHLFVDDPEASRRHGEILVTGIESVEVRDADSTNGIWRHGKRVTRPFVMRPGDSFMVGGARVRLLGLGTEPSEALTVEESPELGFADTDPNGTPVNLGADGRPGVQPAATLPRSRAAR